MGVAANRSFARFFLSGAAEVELDQLGRILIPDHLKEHADLQKNCIVTGVHDRVEIWNESRWQEFKKKASGNADELAERLGQIGAY